MATTKTTATKSATPKTDAPKTDAPAAPVFSIVREAVPEVQRVITSRKTKEKRPNPFQDVVNGLPVVGDGPGMVKTGTAGGAAGFDVPGKNVTVRKVDTSKKLTPENTNPDWNSALVEALRELSEAGDARTVDGKAAPVTVRRTLNEVTNGDNTHVHVSFWLAPKMERKKADKNDTTDTTEKSGNEG